MSATPKELIEAVNGVRAIEELMGGPLSGQSAMWAVAQGFAQGGGAPSTVRGPEDATEDNPVQTGPVLTGDPEWDALELADWDPSNPPLKVVR